MQTFTYAAAAHVTFGAGAIQSLPDRLKGHQRVLVVTDRGLVAAGLAGRVADQLAVAGAEPVIFDAVDENPRLATVEAAVRLGRLHQCDAVLGLGGGSPMDVAKVAAALLPYPDAGPLDLEGNEKLPGDPLPLVLVPTTAGTGAEVTRFAVITDPARPFKFTVISRRMLPQAAIVDPELTLTLPPGLTAATGMDALTHAIESYTNRVYHPVADLYAARAIELIGRSLRTAVAQGRDLAARTDMLLASLLAAMAFTHTRLGNVHAMSHAVGAHFNVPHGVANAILLPPVMEYNLPACIDRTADVGRLLGEPLDGLSRMEAARRAVAAVRQLAADVGIPAGLAAAGVQTDRIPALAADAMQSGNIEVNPRQTRQEDLEALLRDTMREPS